MKLADRQKMARLFRRIANIINEKDLNGPTAAEFLRGAAFWAEQADPSRVTGDEMIEHIVKGMQH
jgi:hypothetical protein